MVWDKTKPLGDEPLKFGDNRIRELKQDLEMAFQSEHHFPVDANNPKLIPKIPAGSSPPIPALTGRLYFDTNTYLRTFVIYTGSEWEKVSNNFDTLPSNTYFVSNKTGNFIQLHSLTTTYAVRISSQWLTNLDSYTGNNPVSFTHTHSVVDQEINRHSHYFSGETPQAGGADSDSYAGSKIDNLASNTHKHPLNVVLYDSNLNHTHTVLNCPINYKYYQLSVYKIVL